jgi:hypothetical protein
MPFCSSGARRTLNFEATVLAMSLWEPRVDFFPPVVSPELWNRAHSSMDSRRVLTAKGEVTSTAGGRNDALHNLFASLVTDGNMKLPMHWQDKGKRSRPKLATYSQRSNAEYDSLR